MISAPSRSTAWPTIVRDLAAVSARTGLLLPLAGVDRVLVAAADQPPVDDGEHRDQEEQRPADGRAVAEPVEDERLLVQVEHDGGGLAAGPADVPVVVHREQHLRLGEQLQPADGGGDGDEQDHRAEHREGDPEEGLTVVGAVDLGRADEDQSRAPLGRGRGARRSRARAS